MYGKGKANPALHVVKHYAMKWEWQYSCTTHDLGTR